MTRKKIYIPEEVKRKIKEHLSEKYKLAIIGYKSANEEEDALTGDLGATLRVKNQKVFVQNSQIEFPGTWTWSIDYHKFRGRGPNATENILGADGLFELTLEIGNRVEQKTVLFQSKINWEDDPNLLKQAIKLTTWREASFILNYTSKVFEAINLDAVIFSKGRRNNKITSIPLDKFLGENFLDCLIGDTELKYDAAKRKLIWRTNDGQIIATKFSIPHRLEIQIKAPNRIHNSSLNYDEEINNDVIYNYRMNTSEEEILSLNQNYSLKDIKKARDDKALIFHSDLFNLDDQLLKDILNRRMQEINSAYSTLKNKNKK